ncbi:30S ribosomal protein S7 [Candidatus Haliotispira prima]|uniref:Small ribosomal subunit protein uS7 n=1 Tax=Candidatus Haliotispira prima TaxID=3034016 RepID=A0ABY8MHA2_9SPIO|nr:30S ribosomal protein S7 [Candidatus Haliotispira prima]
MSRKKRVIPKRVFADARYGSREVEKFITRMMLDGKKSISEKAVYTALDRLSDKSGEEVLVAFRRALENVKPVFEVRSRRVGGSTYQIPVEVRETRREALAMRWLIQAARSRSGRGMDDRLASELLDAFNGTGTAVKKKEDVHRMAEANKAFAHYRW